MPTLGKEFIHQVELIMVRTVGQIVGRSIVQNQLKKLHKDDDALSAADFSVISNRVVESLALFVTKQEVETARHQLDQLTRNYC